MSSRASGREVYGTWHYGIVKPDVNPECKILMSPELVKFIENISLQ